MFIIFIFFSDRTTHENVIRQYTSADGSCVRAWRRAEARAKMFGVYLFKSSKQIDFFRPSSMDKNIKYLADMSAVNFTALLRVVQIRLY